MNKTASQQAELPPNLMREVALGLADGQIHQADILLCHPERLRGGRGVRDAHVRALEHMLSACGWLRSAAETTATTGRLNALLTH